MRSKSCSDTRRSKTLSDTSAWISRMLCSSPSELKSNLGAVDYVQATNFTHDFGTPKRPEAGGKRSLASVEVGGFNCLGPSVSGARLGVVSLAT